MADQRDQAFTRLIEQFTSGDISRRELMRRVAALGGALAFAGSAVAVAPSTASGAQQDPRRVRKLSLAVQPQANVPEEFEGIQLAAGQLKQIGLDLEIQVMPWEQMSDLVWFNRQQWDMTAWQMVGRPERLDPDEFVYNLFHSSTIEKGYNFVGYNNPEYDKLAEAQRVEMDREKRKELLYQLQEIVANDQPYIFFVYPHENYAYSSAVWDPASIIEAKGIGIKNFWTFVRATPLAEQKDMILNTQAVVQAINPLYISGGTDSWITELVWDRLMRINPEGFPEPFAAEKVEWQDDTTVLVTLRSGMTWHDGQPVTVDDVVFSFQAPAGDMSPMYKPFVAPIASVTPVGDNQVEFKLTSPFAAFETAGLAKVNLIPRHVWEPVFADLEAQGINAEEYQEETPIGSGPFKFVNWARSQEIILEANSAHFQAPKMGRWILRDMPNVSAALGGLTSGEINFLSEYTGDPELLKQTVDSTQGLTMVSTIVVGFRFLAPNERRPPFDDAALRRAMATAIGKDQIQTNIYKSFADIADSHVSKALEFWHAPDLPDYATSNIEAARQILQEAGYSWDGEGFLLYPEGKTETLQTGGV
ncbi:MAG: ABC transporter substrate-binding protein [Chloroflexota bacterium]|nr:ABC transporter substrate-binding protein [Chloroflexota bacterium]